MPASPVPAPRAVSQLRLAVSLLAAALLGLHLLLANRMSFEDLRFAMMGAVALVAVTRTASQRIQAEVGLGSIAVGALLIGFGIWRVQGQPGAVAAALAPLAWGLGLALIIGGGRHLAGFWREGLIVLGLVVSPFVEPVVLELIGFDLAPGTARFTAALLRLLGWDASARDVIISLPEAWLVVSQGCSGLKTTYALVGFAVIVLLLYPPPGWGRKLAILLGAAVIGYFVNAIRVAILALLAAPGHEQAFRFWHIQQGAMAFEILAVAVFLGFAYCLMPVRSLPAIPEPPRA